MTTASSKGQRISLSASAIGRVNDILRGPVIDIFLEHVPAFRRLTREQAFDIIMNNPVLTDECLKLFRKKPQLFDNILVDARGRPVGGEDQTLACGRSLADVVALIVRAVAKRHFHARLAPTRPIAATPSLWRRLIARLRRSPVPRLRRKATRADSLYRALREFLLYEWQLPLIPHYVPLPVSVVRRLGPRILEYRQPQQLKTLLLEGLPPEDENDDSASAAIIGETGDAPRPARPGVNAEAMWKASQTLGLGRLFDIDENEMRRTIAHVSAVSGRTLAALAAAGLKMRETVVVLCTVDRLLGHTRMAELFGAAAGAEFLSEITALFRREGVAAMRDPANIREATQKIFTEMRKSGLVP